MKGKRLAAMMLTLVMTLSLLATSASAVSFTDMTNHWAKEDVEYLANLGVVKGLSDTTFAPNQKMTACEALLFCSRTTGVSATDKEKIAKAWAEKLKDLLPEAMYSWAAEEMAVCLETGIITEAELKAMNDAGGLTKSISRENLAMYLVRAMQLAPLAQSLTSYPLTFADASSIAPSLQPYVYLLSMYGIVKGNQANQFLPQDSLTRAEMATMLRRALDFMDERGIYAELPAYTDYEWVGGTIAAVTNAGNGVTLLTLNSDLSGTQSISLPAGVQIYENNMLSTTSALRAGQYARVNLNKQGAAQSVRLGGALTSFTGSVSSVTQDSLVMVVDGISRSMTIDRFTKVKVGNNVGDSSLIDLEAGYTSAICYVDGMGHLAGVSFAGGSRAEGGLLTKVEDTVGGQTLLVSAFNGEINQYTLPTGAGVTINGLVGTLTSANVGDYVSLRVSNDDPTRLVSIGVDTITQYIQGSIKSFTYTKAVNDIALTNLGTGYSTTYEIAPNATVRYNGQEILLRDLEKSSYATLQFSGGQVVMIDAYPASATTQGTIQSISYGTTTTLTVLTDGEQVVSFTLDLTSLPTVYRDGVVSSIDKLKTGDHVIVTVRYNKVTTLETTSQNANVTGTITRVVQDTSGITVDVRLSDGTTASYTVSEGVSVSQDGTPISIYDLKYNDKVAMVVSGDQVISMEVDKSASAGTQLTGTVLIPNTKEKTLMIQLSDGNAVVVDTSSSNFMSSDGSSSSLGSLRVGDSVQVYGSYSGAQFKATLVIRLL